MSYIPTSMKRLAWACAIAAACLMGGAGAARAGEPLSSLGQTVYVPVYSHIYSGDKEQRVNLTSTLSIRNTDGRTPIVLEAVDYYDSNGKLVKHYLEKAVVIDPMSTRRYVVNESDKAGGSGANFIVQWRAVKQAASKPLIESVMISTTMQQGISFTSRGQVIEERPAD